MEARQTVGRHADHAVPLGLEFDAGEPREQLGERAARPGAVDRQAGSAQRADAAEHQPARLVEAERAQNLARVPAALPLRQDRAPGRLVERDGGEVEIGQMGQLRPQLGPRRDRVGVGGDEDPFRPRRALRRAQDPAIAVDVAAERPGWKQKTRAPAAIAASARPRA